MPTIEEQIRQLSEEAAKEEYQLPGATSLAYNHPGVFAYQIKTQPHYQRDMQRASWLKKVADLQDKYRADGRGLEFRDAINPKFMEIVDRRDEIATPYWNRGVLAFGQPVREGLNWAGSFPAMAFNAGRMVAGVDGADRDFEDSADVASMRTLGLATGRQSPTQVAWEAERLAEERRPITDLSAFQDSQSGARILPTMENAIGYEGVASRGQTTGSEVIGEAMGLPKGMAPGWQRQIGGAMLESVVDPVGGLRSGIRALIGRNLPRAAADIGSEMALPTMFIAAQEGLKRQAEQWARDHAVSKY